MKKGTRLSLMLAMVVVLMLFLSVPIASAKQAGTSLASVHAVPQRPLTSCSTACSGEIGQGGYTIHGFEDDFTIDSPGGSGFSYYTKYINLNNPNGDAIYVGIDKGNYCPNATQIEFFYFAHDADNVSNDVLNCYSMNANDINHTAHFALSYYVSNGGGAFFWIQNTFTGDSPCPNACAVANPDLDPFWWRGRMWRLPHRLFIHDRTHVL